MCPKLDANMVGTLPKAIFKAWSGTVAMSRLRLQLRNPGYVYLYLSTAHRMKTLPNTKICFTRMPPIFSLLLDQANHDPKAGQPLPEAKIFKDDELRNMIDPIMDADDRNRDGFIDYPEFIAAQNAAQTAPPAAV